jgi:hypothetical protein
LFRPLGLGDLQKGERQVMDIYFPHLWGTDLCFTDSATWIIYSCLVLQDVG